MQSILRIFIGLMFISSAVLKGIAIKSFTLVARDFLNLIGIDFLSSEFTAIAVCIGEGIIGIMAMSPFIYKRIHWIYPIVMIFFTCLTYLNLTDPYGGIESCGCFGEVIHLNPLQSFLKNLLLLTLTIVASILTIICNVGTHPRCVRKGASKSLSPYKSR